MWRLFALALFVAAPAHSAKFTLLWDSDRAVCRAALSKVTKWSIKRSGALSGEFFNVPSSIEYFWSAQANTSFSVDVIRYDIDNDGVHEVMVGQWGRPQNNFYEWAVFTSKEYEKARSAGFPAEAIAQQRTITTRDVFGLYPGVQFPFIYPWRFRGRNYLILEDQHFASRKGGSMLVTELADTIANLRDAKLIVLQSICQIM
jgi:hypothetical protein